MKWVTSYKGTFIICEIMLIAMTLWFMSWVPAKAVEQGTEITVAGYVGGYADIEAGSNVCATAITEDGEFRVDTPSGAFRSTEEVGRYHYGSGCFAPGKWIMTDNAPAMKLTNPNGVKSTVYAPFRIKYGMPIMLFIVMNFMIGLIILSMWARQYKSENS